MEEKAPESEEVSRGQGDGVFEDPKRIRGDAVLARTAARKWADVVDPERVRGLIDKVCDLAEASADAGKVRETVGCMGVVHAFAKLEQDESKAIATKKGDNIQINVNLGSPEQRAASLEDRLIAEAQARGLIADGTVVGDGSGSGDD